MFTKICSRLPVLLMALLLTSGGMFSPSAFAQEQSADSAQEQPLEFTQEQPAQSEELLRSPRRAVHTFLHWQQEGHERPELVVRPFKLSDSSREEKLDLANKLLMILDSRGLLVEYESVPGDPAYVDSLSGMHQYILFPSIPQIYLERTDGEWVFSEPTIRRIPELYSETFSFMVELVDRLPDTFNQEWLGLQAWQYLAIFLWLLTGVVLRKLFEYLFAEYGQRLVGKSSTKWDDKVLREMDKPLSFLFMMSFYWVTYTNLLLSVQVNYYLSTALDIAVSASFVWLFYNFTEVLSEYLTELTSKTESVLDDQLIPLLRKTLKIFVVVIGVIFILQNNGINVTSLLAGLGLGGLAIALAARETLANFFGSLTIFMDKPFQIGDWIRTPNVEGTVEEVGFRSTRVRTFYNSLVSVPNSMLTNGEIDNLGLRRYRRLKMTLNLTYDTTAEQMEAFTEGIRELIRSNENIWQEFHQVRFNDYGANSLDVMVYLFFDVPDWDTELAERHRFLLEIKKLAQEVGVDFAFPTRTLHVGSMPENILPLSASPGTSGSSHENS